uniref:NADH dehydrogenase subunit 4 n=1 Tax=Anagyrus jenniferae TaxID=2058195 RepID=UPI002E7658B5|nr:NADH dehydrogenase subunit 4 [Anagyrus jenniferae]WPT46949.1 NADH dehydrogenase subunit 4 [Anagyrus jenniferae]
MMKLIFYMIMLIFLIFKFMEFNYFYSMLLLLLILKVLFIFNFNSYYMLIYGNLGIDIISFMLILLVLWIFFLVFMVKNFFKKKIYFFNLFLLMLILYLCFCWMNLFMFYLFFEVSLIPIFFLIMGWGYQPERVKASLYMLFYTLFFSLPLLILIFLIYNFNKTLFFVFLNYFSMEELWDPVIYLVMFMGFLVKLPIFMFHNWLPKAHVEAPLVGSMVLAAIMLKLGGYGLYRFIDLMKLNFLLMNDFMINLSIIGLVIISILCLRHYDMKVIVAYSSVVHMGMMLIGFMTLKFWGFLGGLFMMISHGICSSSLFYLVNLFYERTKSRSLLMNKGLVFFIPSMMLFWFLLCMNNMASPVSLNLLSELMIVSVVLNWSIEIMIILIVGMFFSACYSLYLFSFSFHGIFNSFMVKIFSCKVLEFYLVIFHFIPLNFLILKMNFLI